MRFAALSLNCSDELSGRLTRDQHRARSVQQLLAQEIINHFADLLGLACVSASKLKKVSDFGNSLRAKMLVLKNSGIRSSTGMLLA
jgi:hypothetical protein